MSERKKIKVEKNLDDAKKLLETLQEMGKTSSKSSSFENEIEISLENLKDKNTRPFAILAISQIFKNLNPSSSILSEDDLNTLFEAVLKSLQEDKVDISEFATSSIFVHFKNLQLILKFFESYSKILANREALKQILAMFIETNVEDRHVLVNYVVKNHNKCFDFIPRIVKFVEVENIDEDQYIKLVSDCQFFRENTEPRYIKGRKRHLFVEKVIDMHSDFIFKNYIKDRDQRIRIILAKKIDFTNEPFFSILLNDPEIEVRLTLLKRMNCTNVPVIVADRALDRSEKIREEVFRIYNEFINQLQMMDISHGLNIFDTKDDQFYFKESTSISLEELHEKFIKFLSKISEGCLTNFSEEYIKLLSKSKFTLDFLSKNEEMVGLRSFIKTIEITDFKSIPTHLRGFCLEYMFKGDIDNSQIVECIENNVFQVLKFIKDPYLFYDLLVEKAMQLDDLELVVQIVEFIQSLLSHEKLIVKKRAINESFGDTVIEDSTIIKNNDEKLSLNEILINTHTKANKELKEALSTNIGSAVDFSYLYFYVYNCRNNPQTIQSLIKSNIGINQMIRLLIYLNLPDSLGSFVDLLLKCKVDYKIQQLLLTNRTVVSAMIYFLSTGQVTISSIGFFIKAIKCCLFSEYPEKVEFVFKKYTGSLSQTAFDTFYSICWILKECIVSNIDCNINSDKNDSLLLNPMLIDNCDDEMKNVPQNTTINNTDMPRLSDTVINTAMDTITDIAESENIKNIKQIKGLKLSKKDKMLSCICNSIIGLREGNLVEVSFDPIKYGFSKLNEQQKDMIEHGQVTYE